MHLSILQNHPRVRRHTAGHAMLAAGLAVVLAGCAANGSEVSVVDRMAEPFMSLLTGEELADVSTDPQYARPPEAPDAGTFVPFDTGLGRPLAVVQFDSPLATYNQPLGMAVGRALEVHPEVKFEVVAVSPAPAAGQSAMAQADRALENARTIMQDLIRHGVEPARISMNAMSDPAVTSDGEVHIYVRP